MFAPGPLIKLNSSRKCFTFFCSESKLKLPNFNASTNQLKRPASILNFSSVGLLHSPGESSWKLFWAKQMFGEAFQLRSSGSIHNLRKPWSSAHTSRSRRPSIGESFVHNSLSTDSAEWPFDWQYWLIAVCWYIYKWPHLHIQLINMHWITVAGGSHLPSCPLVRAYRITAICSTWNGTHSVMKSLPTTALLLFKTQIFAKGWSDHSKM